MWNLKEKMGTLLRFCTVGVGNTLIDFIVFFVLTGLHVHYLWAQGCSYLAGMINSYIWNRNWTFKAEEKANIQELLRFLTINLAAYVATLLFLYLFQQKFEWSLAASKIIATLGGMVITFMGSRLWVFKSGLSKERSS